MVGIKQRQRETVAPLVKATVSHNLQDANIVTFADLFCGIGGFHYAASALGLRCVFASDIDEKIAKQYEHCHRVVVAGDITEIKSRDIPKHDILFAGFPCQPFSIIGKRQGLDDTRGTIFHEITRILKYRLPAAFVLENVKQLTTHNGGRTMNKIITAIKRIGYEVDYKVLNALDFGLPQKRERVLIVGMLSGLEYYEWPKSKKKYIPLADLLEVKVAKRHYVSQRIRKSRQAMHTSKYKPGIWHENKGGNISSHPFSCALRANASYNYLLVDGKRRLTPREMLRLQGFPERFDIIGSDCELRKQVGNAVPVPMIRAVIREVLNAKSKNKRQSKSDACSISA